MDIASDTYFITNVKYFVSLAMADPKQNSTSIVATPSSGENRTKWKITRLQDQRYNIQNYEHQEHQCWSQSPARVSDKVQCKRGSSKEWTIKPKTGPHGAVFYTISPTDNKEMLWGMVDGQANTELELRSGSAVDSNCWIIHKVPRIVQQIVDATTMKFEWMDTTTHPFDAQVAVTLDSGNSQCPEGAYISFPEDLDVVWEGKLIGTAQITGEFYQRAQQVVGAESNTRIHHGKDGLIGDFIQSIIKKKAVIVEVRTRKVNVYASGKLYENADVDFRKTVTMDGFNDFEGCITIHDLRVVGSHPRGDGVTAAHKVQIENPTNISVNVDDLPIEIGFKGKKIGSLNLQNFKLHRKSTGAPDMLEAVTQFKPEDPQHTECQEFVKDYITTNRSLEISCNLTGTIIMLGNSHKVSIPLFSVRTSVEGINKQFLKGITAYISIIRTPITTKVGFDFEIENPVNTDLRIVKFVGEAKRDGKLFCRAKAEGIENFVIQSRARLCSPKFKDGSVKLRRYQMLSMLFRGSLKVNCTVTSATVHIGKFELPDLQFTLDAPIHVKLKWSLL